MLETYALVKFSPVLVSTGVCSTLVLGIHANLGLQIFKKDSVFLLRERLQKRNDNTCRVESTFCLGASASYLQGTFQ